jgi:membrane-bound serine protease (ClpP class)
VGFVLLAAELFLPTSGVLLVSSLACIAGGVGLTLYLDVSVGLLTLLAVVVALPVVGGVLLRYWPRTRMGKRLFLNAPEEDATVASMPGNQELERLRGRFGRAVSDLRPSGVTDFDGWRVDTITEGIPVEAGGWVRCVDVRAGRVIVRPVDGPRLDNLEEIDLTK